MCDNPDFSSTGSWSSPSSPNTIAPSKSAKTQGTFAFVHRPLCNSTLSFYTLDNFIKLGFYHDSSHNHLAKRGMQCLEIEDEVQFADILEEAVKGLYEDLDEVEKGKRRFGGSGYDDEVECRVVAICDE